MTPPATEPANQKAEPTIRPRRSPRLNPELDQVCAIKGPPGDLAPQSKNSPRMARTYPLFVSYNQCLGAKEDPLSFASLSLEDLRNGQTEYLSTMKQLVDALPKTENPASRFTSRGHIAHPGQQRLRHSMRAALWRLLPSDGEFRRSSHSLQYYLARQGRRVVLQGGDVTRRIYENRFNWIPDPMLPAPRRLDDLTSPAPASTIDTLPSEVGRGSQQQQPIEIRHLARLTPRPRLSRQPMRIRPAGLPAQQPGRSQRPMELRLFQDHSLEPGVLCRSIPKASPPLICHSIPIQQPIKIEIAHFAWTTQKSGGCINWPGLTPDRIRLPTSER